jgi:hypothetical protein
VFIEKNKNSIIAPVGPESIVSVLGVTYVHCRTSDGGDMYLTRFGLPFSDLLAVENWYDKKWFETNRERLPGTSAVYRIYTKEVNNRSLNLVVKNCRVGEDVPLDTKTLLEFINTEFNSPWEEFALVFEMRDGRYGPRHVRIRTQEPLAIYVPPLKMQLWQSGRSADKINRIMARHPGIDLDILRQYKLIYRWIEGKNVVEVLEHDAGFRDADLLRHLTPLTKKSISDMAKKGYAVADMKPVHIILSEDKLPEIGEIAKRYDERAQRRQSAYVRNLIKNGDYSIIDYELLIRTEEHAEEVKASRRHTYLDDQRDRLKPTPLPDYLTSSSILGVPYICGRVESTGGALWVVGRNARLYDYFLPERWRTSHCLRLSENSEIYYTLTKDNVHLVWKISRVGETPITSFGNERDTTARRRGYNSPFEEFSVAQHLGENGVPVIYMRAIYRTGSLKVERSTDPRRYASHSGMVGPDNQPVLLEDRNYISLRGYYNGPDEWVAHHKGDRRRPMDVKKALQQDIISADEYRFLFDTVRAKIRNAGYDGSLLGENDLLLSIDRKDGPVKDRKGRLDVRVCNFELIFKT